MQCHTASVHYFKLKKCNFYSSWTTYYSLIEYYMCHFMDMTQLNGQLKWISREIAHTLYFYN